MSLSPARLLARLLLALGLLLACLPAAHAQSRGRGTYEVAPGDTLGAIARRHRVTVEDLQRWNNLRNDRIREGQVLVVVRPSGASSSRSRSSSTTPDRQRDTHTVRSGETATVIARRYDVSLAELQRWNRSANLDRLRIGQQLVVYTESRVQGPSGTPNRGRLRGGLQLQSGVGFRVRNPDRAYGTPSTISYLRNGIARVSARHVDVPDLVIHDLSFQRGGRMSPHASHQNGLDADVTYYRTGVTQVCDWRVVEPHELDVRLQWYLFRTWLEQGAVEYIFMDYGLQGPLYEFAAARGATESQLAEWFEYPNRGSRGIIRHERGHADHFHVRFRPVRSG
jgi:LysM repeat protein